MKADVWEDDHDNDFRREDDQPESECSPLVDPGSGERVQQPVFLILKQLLPTYLAVTNNYASDSEMTEAVCLNLKQAVSTLQNDIRPLTPEVDIMVMSRLEMTL